MKLYEHLLFRPLGKQFSYFSLILLIFSFLAATARAQDSVVWEQGYGYGAGGVADFGPSQKAGSTAYTLDQELADDINMVGTISRVDVHGYTSGFITPDVTSDYYYGLNIRFYAFGADQKPGALLAEYFISKTSVDFLYQSDGLGDLRVRLATPFQATGRHFVTVQAVLDPVMVPGNGGATQKWYWRSDNAVEPIREQGFYFRENSTAPWGRTEPNDGSRNLSMRLWGTRSQTLPPTISQISADTLPQAGRLKITGTNFGNTQGTSSVVINGATAIISYWSETQITAYISDQSTIGTGSVTVVTEGGSSNPKPITVQTRPGADGRVKWRFQADDSYIIGRPAVGTDGTIYSAGVDGHLYALTPNGGLKWIFRGSSPVMQSVTVGADNTAYFVGGNVVYALNPNGTLKWQIANPSGGAFVAGPNVGPDGNIYAVASLADPNNLQLGAITISPAGQVINNRPGYVEPRTQALYNREIVFGSNQFYFGGLNNVPFGTGGLEVFQLGGSYRLTISAAGGRQPAVAPDGTIYAIRGANTGSPERLGAFSPTDGGMLREILPTETYLTHPDIGADGTIYITHNLTTLSAYTPTGANLWNFDPVGSIYGSAVVNPQNTVVTTSGYDYAEPGVIYGVSNTGQSLWTVNLPAENGGFVRTISRAKFTLDGETVYYGTDVNSYAADVYSYLYAITATAAVPCSFSLTPASASYPYNGGTGNITATATNSTCAWTAASNVGWITVQTSGGSGNGTIAYTVTANPDFTPRTGTITIGGQTFTVTQAERTTTTTVNITYPTSGANYTLPTNLFVRADAATTVGTIARVEFYANDALIGTDASSPHQIAWNHVSAQNYTLVAKAFDQNGVATLSQPVAITVMPVPPPAPAPLPIPPPTLTSPTANQVFAAGESVIFSAVPGQSQYPVVRMEFYLDTTFLGSDNTAPYGFTLTSPAAGRYSVSARTVANTGARATSQPVDITVNSGSTPTPTETPTPSISGMVTYANSVGSPAQRLVSGVAVTGTGSSGVSTATGYPDGTYTLTGFGPGSYTVTLSKGGAANGSITSFDAAKIAQHTAGTATLTANQLVAADVSGNGSVTSFDAGQVARFAAGVAGQGSTGNWVFGPASRAYPSVTGSVAGENYSALLMGEVSGNWTNAPARPVGSGRSAKSIGIKLPTIIAQAGKAVTVPVSVQGIATKGVISYEFDLKFDPSVIQPDERPFDATRTVSRGLSVVTNEIEPGLLRVVVYGPMPIERDGVLVNLRFTAIGEPGSASPLAWEHIVLNEGSYEMTATDGRVQLSATALTRPNFERWASGMQGSPD
jgi:hypothetical protein